VLRCYEEKSGESWSNVLQHVQANLDCLPLSSPVVEFYFEQESQTAINRIRRIVSSQLKAATDSAGDSVAGPMSEIISSKMRYAKKMMPEERWEAKLSHLSDDSSESSLEEQSDEHENQAKSKKPRNKQKRSKGKGKGKKKGKAEDAHVAMCKKAMSTLDKVNKLLDKYDDSSSSSD